MKSGLRAAFLVTAHWVAILALSVFSPSVIRCSIIDSRGSAFGTRCSVFEVRCSGLGVRGSVFGTRCSRFEVRCSMFGVRCLDYINTREGARACRGADSRLSTLEQKNGRWLSCASRNSFLSFQIRKQRVQSEGLPVEAPIPDSRVSIPDSRFPILDSRVSIPETLKLLFICYLCHPKS